MLQWLEAFYAEMALPEKPLITKCPTDTSVSGLT